MKPTFFTLPVTGDVCSVVVNQVCRGDCIIVKFLGSREGNAEWLSVANIELFGYEENTNEVSETRSMSPQFDFLLENFTDDSITGVHLTEFMLRFLYLASGGRDISKRRGNKGKAVTKAKSCLRRKINRYSCLRRRINCLLRGNIGVKAISKGITYLSN